MYIFELKTLQKETKGLRIYNREGFSSNSCVSDNASFLPLPFLLGYCSIQIVSCKDKHKENVSTNRQQLEDNGKKDCSIRCRKQLHWEGKGSGTGCAAI